MQIGTNSVVSIHYTLRDETGEVLDASEAVSYTHLTLPTILLV